MSETRKITLRVLDGPNKGEEFISVPLPLSIGREPGNTVLLNDERISRYHLKIVEMNGKCFVVDAGSTNGTRVNGETVVAGEIHPGDIISVGRSMFIVGSRREIRERLDERKPSVGVGRGIFGDMDEWDDMPEMIQREMKMLAVEEENPFLKLQQLLPPPIPRNLNVEHLSFFADMLLYYQLRLRNLILAGVRQTEREPGENTPYEVTFRQEDWQNLLDVYARTAEYLKDLNGI